MDLNVLLLFVDIVDAGSLSLAASRLKVSRSSVSHRLKAFEEGVGVQLLRRTTRRIEPTEIGWKLYQHAKNIGLEHLAAQEVIASHGETPHGSVRISLPTGLGQLVLMPLLLEFIEAYPEIRLDVLFENKITDLLGDGVDIALRVMSTPPESLVARELGSIHWKLCATPDYWAKTPPIATLEDLKRHRMITSGASGRRLKVSARLGEEHAEIHIEPSLVSENFIFLKEAVMAGLGAGLFPTYLIHGELQSGRLTSLLNSHRISVFGSRVLMLSMATRYRPNAARLLMEHLKRGTPAVLGAY